VILPAGFLGDTMGVEMSEQAPDPMIPFATDRRAQPEGNLVLDESGNAIIEMLHKAANMAKGDCARAMDAAHRLSFELRAAEDRARVSEAEAAHFRDRASKAEAWLLRIHNQIDQTFFQRNEQEPQQQQPAPRNSYAPPYARGDRPDGGKPKGNV
jgi:hypothetical protein